MGGASILVLSGPICSFCNLAANSELCSKFEHTYFPSKERSLKVGSFSVNGLSRVQVFSAWKGLLGSALRTCCVQRNSTVLSTATYSFGLLPFPIDDEVEFFQVEVSVTVSRFRALSGTDSIWSRHL